LQAGIFNSLALAGHQFALPAVHALTAQSLMKSGSERLLFHSNLQLCVLAVLLTSSIAAAQAVSPELFNGLKWRMIGPFRGGRVVAVAGVPGNSTTFYFGGVDGGVWKTADAGTVWTPIFDGQPVASIGAIAVAPSDPSVIYVGTGESDIRSDLASGNGVYRSTDTGRTWQHMGLDQTRQISRIVVDPQDPQIVFVGALGHAYGPNEERGVYKSVDGGTHWEKVLDQGLEIGISDLAICSGNSSLLFATTWHTHRPPWSVYAPIDAPGAGLFRSQDAGKTWSHLQGNGLPQGDWGRAGVAVATNGQRVYALIAAKKGGLYRSDDGGNSWVLENTDSRLISRAWYFNSITVDPLNEDVIYMPNVALYRSEDGGQTITIVRGAPGGDDYHQIWVDPKNSSSMVLGTDQGTSISLDRGTTWSTWYNQPTAQIYHVITDNAFPYTVYGPQQDSGAAAVVSRTDHGQITPRDWFPAGPSESGYMVLDPSDPDIIYLSGTYGTVSRHNRRTGLSQNITPWPALKFETEINLRKYRAPWSPVLVDSPAEPHAIYFGTQYVMKTLDGGLHWETISGDLTGATEAARKIEAQGPPSIENAKERGYGVISAIAPSSLHREVIWVGSDTGLVHLTRDGGKNWKDVTPPGLSDWSAISEIEPSHFDPAVAYAAVSRSRLNDQTPYLYRTRDWGGNWQLITTGVAVPAFLRSIREDPQTKGLLFAGTEFGVYVSFDDGEHWESLQLNLPVTSVRDLKIHSDDLVIATHGRSFWILDNITPLRQVADAMKAHAPWLYRPAVAIRVDNDSFSATPLPPEEPTAENPPSGAMLDYFLNSPAKEVSLEIFDAQRNLVRRFSSDDKSPKHGPLPIAERWFPKAALLEKTPGMHRFVWNLIWDGEEPAIPDDDDSRFPGPPKAVPGTYLVRLTVDGRSQEQPLQVVMDPRCPATSEVLIQQFRLAQQIYREATDARRTIAAIHSTQKQLNDDQQKESLSAEIKSALVEASSRLDKMLVGTTPGQQTIGLQDAYSDISSALRVVEGGDREAPAQAIVVYKESSDQIKLRTGEWNEFKQSSLPQLNQKLQQVKLPAIVADAN
jgi:photosystem II stability/assembly factor-like uncharacterized protein